MISVVIPLYNSKRTISACVDSVLNQTKVDLITEILVVDDGSTDGSGDLVRTRYAGESRVRVIRKENGGVSTARNRGIQEAKGEWIALLDSDDRWLPEKIEKQWDALSRHPEIRFIGTNRNHERVRWGRKMEEDLYCLDLKHILIKNWPHTSTALIHREVFQSVGLFDETMRYAEDGDLWNRIAIRYGLYYIPQSYEIAGEGKNAFGESGLSANLKAMHYGNVKNLRTLRKRGEISVPFYIFLRAYHQAKYYRRIVISGLIRARRKK